MDWNPSYHRYVPMQKNRIKKRSIRRQIASFSIVSKMAIFSQNGKGGTIGKFSKMADFLGKLRKAEKWEIQVAQYPN